MLKRILLIISLTFALVCTFAVIASADEVKINVTGSDGYATDFMLDDNYRTSDYYKADAYLTVKSDTPMDSLYIVWDTEPGEWTLTVDGSDYTFGTHDYLHEFVELPNSSSEVKITIKKDRTYIADLYAFSGSTPTWVQKWQDSYDRADMLVISTHSDDEILFLGGAIATTVNEEKYRVQLAYYCDFSLTEIYRRHELLNGLWKIGITHYPQLGEYMDEYSEDLATAKTQVDYDEVVGYMVRTIRRFKPQVVVSQDFDGEYGHGQHRLVAAAIADALEVSADASQYKDSADKYGTWDVPKTYYHLYADNPIKLDVRTPLSHFGGKTALEIAQEAYLEHQSQQWMWFHVSDGIDDAVPAPDGYSYSPITDFGLYRTLVGADTGNDMMENIVSYDQQEAEAAQTETTDEPEDETESKATPGGDSRTPDSKQLKTDKLILKILIVLAVILGIIIILIIVLNVAASKKRKKQEEARSRRQAEQRRAQQRAQQSRGIEQSAPRSRPQSSTGNTPSGRSSRVKEIKVK